MEILRERELRESIEKQMMEDQRLRGKLISIRFFSLFLLCHHRTRNFSQPIDCAMVIHAENMTLSAPRGHVARARYKASARIVLTLHSNNSAVH